MKNIMTVFLTLITCSAAIAEEQTYTEQTYSMTHARGFIQSEQNQNFLRQAPRISFATKLAPVPSKSSLRGVAGPVEDQGQCGSCWDFALTTTLRGTLKLAGRDPGRLSFNYLLNCATEMDACKGGDFSAAAHFNAPLGAPAYGSDGPYTARAGKCQKETPIASSASYRMLGNSESPSFQEIAYAIGVLHRPVATIVVADKSWDTYSSGVYNRCTNQDPQSINHMVVIEGYDCETSVDENGQCQFDSSGNLPPGIGRWLIRNSWGTDWGDSGYITVKATTNTGLRCNAVGYQALIFDLLKN